MPIEIRLKKLLEKNGLDGKGIEQRIAADLDVHRHSIGKLYRNQSSHPSLQLLDRICSWLSNQGVPRQDLPQQLFGMQASELWEAMTAPGTVTFHLGEYQQETGAPTHGQRWISRRDSETVDALVEHLTEENAAIRTTSLQFHTVYISFRALPETGVRRQAILKADIASSQRVFQQMRSQTLGKTSILIGSQRVNYLLEHLVADLFSGCEPFRPGNVNRIPFYLKYRQDDSGAPSCFGGLGGLQSFERPGIHYLKETQDWGECPWEPHRQDSGVVIILRDPGNENMEVALFGFSGRATITIGRHLHTDAVKFWPLAARWRDKEVGVYICRIEFRPNTGDPDVVLPNAKVEVIPIAKSILEERLR